MIERFDIAGYARISVDDEQDQKNISIENQKAIIEDYAVSDGRCYYLPLKREYGQFFDRIQT